MPWQRNATSLKNYDKQEAAWRDYLEARPSHPGFHVTASAAARKTATDRMSMAAHRAVTGYNDPDSIVDALLKVAASSVVDATVSLPVAILKYGTEAIYHSLAGSKAAKAPATSPSGRAFRALIMQVERARHEEDVAYERALRIGAAAPPASPATDSLYGGGVLGTMKSIYDTVVPPEGKFQGKATGPDWAEPQAVDPNAPDKAWQDRMNLRRAGVGTPASRGQVNRSTLMKYGPGSVNWRRFARDRRRQGRLGRYAKQTSKKRFVAKSKSRFRSKRGYISK